MGPLRIAIVAPPSETLDNLNHVLHRKGGHDVKTFISMADVQARFVENSFDLLLVQLPSFSIERTPWTLRLRARFPKLALVILSREVDANARFQLRHVSRLKLVDEDFEMKDVAQIVSQMTQPSVAHAAKSENEQSASARQHTRTDREGWAELSDVNGGGLKLKAKFLDFAQMGARVLVESGVIQSKTKWILRYPSSTEPGKIQSLYCYVAWESNVPKGSDLSPSGAHQILGLRFVAAA